MNKYLKKLMIAGAAAGMVLSVPVYAATGTVQADILNVRSLPSTDSSIVGTLNWGDTVAITYDCGNNWYEIYQDSGCYYVNASYISGGSTASAPAEQSYTDSSYEESYTTAEESVQESTEASVSSNGTYLGNFALTAYCACSRCCGSSNGTTASGTVPTAGRTVAMGGVPFGTKLLINGNVYTVEDRGTSYGTVDIFFNNHSDALAFGLQYADVYQVD